MLATISLNLSTYVQLSATVQVAIIPLQASATASKLILLQSLPHTAGSSLLQCK